MNTLISVIIPIFNQERYLGECLDSVFRQCTDEIEVVLVNDGSTDKSFSICEDYIKRYHVNAVLLNQENSGSLKSRVNGVSHSSGEYVMFMDSDDVLMEHAFETIVDALRKRPSDMIMFNATRDLALCKPAFRIPLPHGQIIEGDEKYSVHQLLCESGELNNLWSKCIKRNLYLESEMPENGQRLTNGEDLYQILDVADKAQSFLYLDRILYYYRVVTDSISRVYNPFYFDSEKTVCKKRLQYAERWSRKGELVFGARIQTYKVMRETARKVFVSDLSWKECKKEMLKLRNDAFFRKYYMSAHDAPDRRDIVLKAPLLVFHLARILMGKGKAK